MIDTSVSAGATPRVYVVVVHYGDIAPTLECLESLRRLDYPDFRVVVVNNGPGDLDAFSMGESGQWGEPPTILDAGGNRGFASGANIGLAHAQSRGDAAYCWLLNNDTVVAPDALSALVRCAEADPSIGLCGSTLLDQARPDRVQALGGGRYDRWWGRTRLVGRDRPFGATARSHSFDFVHGASLLVSRAFLDAVGPLDDRYFLYFEDIDWAMRGKGRFRLAYAPGSLVWHKDGGSVAAPAARSRRADYYGIRNRILFTRKYHPLALPTVYLGLVGAMLNRARRGQWDRLGMILRLMLRPT